jgi:hypothetical protein
MRINSSGNVGIGTGSPNTKLTVVGAMNFGANVSAPSVDAGIFRPADGTLAFVANGTERMRIDSSGNVGIGTTTPTSKLGVFVAPGASGSSGLAVTDGTRNLLVQITGSTYSYNGVGANENLIYAGSNPLSFLADGQLIKFCAGSAERMRITSGGDVLIGKTSATANGGDLQVSSGITFPATQVAKSDANTLDDYEEGTWTPTASTNVTGSSGAGTYTKIGRIVHCRGNLNITAISGDFTISGLPFTCSANAYYTSGIPYFPPSVSVNSQTGGQVNSSATTITYYRTGTYSGSAQTCYFAFWYEV